MNMIATIMDERYRGFSHKDHPPVVVPIRARYKWRFWRRPVLIWAVVQPKRVAVGSSIELVWRHVAVFTERADAVVFLDQMNAEEA